MSVSFWMDRSGNEVIKKDIVIIGGGIAGLSTAFWLQKEDPTMSIALVDKGELGEGATGRSAGFVTCGSVEHFNRLVETYGREDAVGIWKYCEENLRLLKEHIVRDEEEHFLWEHKGSYSLASEESEFSELKKCAALMETFDIRVETVDSQGIRERLGGENFAGGIRYIDDGAVQPWRLVQGIRDRIKQNGDNVTFYENTEVYAIENVGDNKLIKTKKMKLEAPVVVYATNGYSPLVNDFFKNKIVPTRGQILATSPVPQFMECPCYANFVLDYFRQLPTGEVLIGGFRQLTEDVEKGYSDETTEVIQNALEQFMARHLPKVKDAKITHRWSGLMGFSSDGKPIIGSLPTDPQLFFIGGFTAHGLGLGFHSGKVLTDAMFGRPVPNFVSARRLQ